MWYTVKKDMLHLRKLFLINQDSIVTLANSKQIAQKRISVKKLPTCEMFPCALTKSMQKFFF